MTAFYHSASEVNPGSGDLAGRHTGELLPGGGGRHGRQTVYISGERADFYRAYGTNCQSVSDMQEDVIVLTLTFVLEVYTEINTY